MQLCAERIEINNEMPEVLQFDHDCLIVLRQTLLAKTPEEGCAILIGNKNNSGIFFNKPLWNVRIIWPCWNIWRPEIFEFLGSTQSILKSKNKKQPSKENRFFLDPKEQIKAQRWARNHDLEVLGSAHSHPIAQDAVPSLTDIELSFNENLMVIVAGSGDVRAWWMSEAKPREIKLLNS